MICHFVCSEPLGKDGCAKSDEFSEKFQRGKGSFSIQKFVLHILGTLTYMFHVEFVPLGVIFGPLKSDLGVFWPF